MDAKKLAGYVFGTLVRPGRTFSLLLKEKRPMAYGLACVLLVGVLYSISVAFGYLNGFGAMVQPFIPIGAKDYYLYETFFTVPAYLLAALTFAAVAQSLSALSGGKGRFEDCVAVSGFALYATILPLMWVPETILMVFIPTLKFPFAPDIARQVLTFVWQAAVVTIGVRKAQDLSWGKTVAISAVAYVAYFAIFWTYIR